MARASRTPNSSWTVTVATVEFRLNRAGLRELLRSPGVQADLEARAQRVAVAMRAAVPSLTGESRAAVRVEVGVSSRGRSRARVILDKPWGMKLAARHPGIAASLDAAGDVGGGGP